MNMTATQPKHSPNPWYKERWTWLLMLMPVTAVIAGSITMWLAVTTFDGLVADDYYKQGLAINQTLARATAAMDLGLTAQVRFTAEDVAVVLAAKKGVELPPNCFLPLPIRPRVGSIRSWCLKAMPALIEALFSPR